MPAERVDAAARPADVAEQELDDRRRPDDLAADGVHRPADRVHDRADSICRAGGADDVGDPEEGVFRASRDSGDGLRRVAVVVPLQKLKDRPRVLERRIAADVAIGVPLVLPRAGVVLVRRGVESGEQAVIEGEAVADNERRVRVGAHVVVVVQVLGQDVPDEAAEQRDVRSGAYLQVVVGDGGCARETRVDRDQPRPPGVARLQRPLEAAGMVLSRVGAHHQHDIGVLDVLPMIGHRAPAERGGQTGHRGAVSYAGLMIDVDEAHRSHRLRDQIGVLVGDGRATDPGDAFASIDRAPPRRPARRSWRRASP